MRSFRLNSSFILAFFLLIPGLLVNGQVTSGSTETQTTWIPPLGTHFEKALFKCVMDISGNHITGLILFKETSDSSFRVVGTNEMGMNYFDFEFFRERFVIHYCFPSFSRKGFLKVIENDLRLLLPDKFSEKRIISNENTEAGNTIYKVKSASGKHLYTVGNDSGTILGIVSQGQYLRKTRIDFLRYGKGIPYKISISNPTIRLQMKLTMLERQK